jgi:hypothetical protein
MVKVQADVAAATTDMPTSVSSTIPLPHPTEQLRRPWPSSRAKQDEPVPLPPRLQQQRSGRRPLPRERRWLLFDAAARCASRSGNGRRLPVQCRCRVRQPVQERAAASPIALLEGGAGGLGAGSSRGRGGGGERRR